MSGVRPLPQPSVLTRSFWEAAGRRVLVHPRCAGCGQSFFPPHEVCPRCREASWSWHESAGRGTLYSFSVVHRAPQPGFTTPYVIAVVDLDEGFDLMTNLVGVDPDAISIGQRVRVAWEPVGDVVLPVFEPDPEATA